MSCFTNCLQILDQLKSWNRKSIEFNMLYGLRWMMCYDKSSFLVVQCVPQNTKINADERCLTRGSTVWFSRWENIRNRFTKFGFKSHFQTLIKPWSLSVVPYGSAGVVIKVSMILSLSTVSFCWITIRLLNAMKK